MLSALFSSCPDRQSSAAGLSNFRLSRSLAALEALALLTALVGCESPQYTDLTKLQSAEQAKPKAVKPESLVLREGDTVRISFPGAPSLDTLQPIRRDGMISLKLVGEFKAAGLTPTEIEKELIKLYGPQLQTKEVTVSVESSAFPVYVTGAVLRPGKIMSDRPLTALEAIMEAGGFDYTKANLKSVRVIRTENGRTEHYTLNLKRALSGEETQQFNLKPSDIVYVPERFSWF